MDGQGAPQKTHTQKESMQEMEARSGGPGEVKGHCPSAGTGLVEQNPTWSSISQVKCDKKNLLQAHKQRKEDQGDCNCVSSLSWTSSSFQSLSFTKKSQIGQTIQMQLVRAK